MPLCLDCLSISNSISHSPSSPQSWYYLESFCFCFVHIILPSLELRTDTKEHVFLLCSLYVVGNCVYAYTYVLNYNTVRNYSIIMDFFQYSGVLGKLTRTQRENILLVLQPSSYLIAIWLTEIVTVAYANAWQFLVLSSQEVGHCYRDVKFSRWTTDPIF